jgi:two-component sensor histidine kinase
MSVSTHFLDGGGEMGEAIRAYDWSSTSLGSLETWPPSLKTAVSMALNSRFPKCIVWGPDLIALYNDAFRPILGTKHPAALGRSFRDIWQEAWDKIGPIADRAFAGEATFLEDFPLTIERFGYPEQTHFTFCYSPIRDEAGKVRGLIDTVIETTEKVQTQARARLLNRELEHRIKNLITVLSALVGQTFRSGLSKEDTQRAIERRIGAFAAAQALLAGSGKDEAAIRDVVETALRPFEERTGRLRTDGPLVMLPPKQALSLTLAINELATNALKYGALSTERGEVGIRWSAGRPNTSDEFRLTWIESGGPAVEPPARRGFGSRMIEAALAHDFRGRAEIRFDPSGLRFELVTQMIHLSDDRERGEDETPSSADPESARSPSAPPSSIASKS